MHPQDTLCLIGDGWIEVVIETWGVGKGVVIRVVDKTSWGSTSIAKLSCIVGTILEKGYGCEGTKGGQGTHGMSFKEVEMK
jgi:hypothetical protein